MWRLKTENNWLSSLEKTAHIPAQGISVDLNWLQSHVGIPPMSWLIIETVWIFELFDEVAVQILLCSNDFSKNGKSELIRNTSCHISSTYLLHDLCLRIRSQITSSDRASFRLNCASIWSSVWNKLNFLNSLFFIPFSFRVELMLSPLWVATWLHVNTRPEQVVVQRLTDSKRIMPVKVLQIFSLCCWILSRHRIALGKSLYFVKCVSTCRENSSSVNGE